VGEGLSRVRLSPCSRSRTARPQEIPA
jgi:hypothetical protein